MGKTWTEADYWKYLQHIEDHKGRSVSAAMQTERDLLLGQTKGISEQHRKYIMELLKIQREEKKLCSDSEQMFLHCNDNVIGKGLHFGRNNCEKELMNLIFCTFPGRHPHEP